MVAAEPLADHREGYAKLGASHEVTAGRPSGRTAFKRDLMPIDTDEHQFSGGWNQADE
jgi:hypothetical protein